MSSNSTKTRNQVIEANQPETIPEARFDSRDHRKSLKLAVHKGSEAFYDDWRLLTGLGLLFLCLICISLGFVAGLYNEHTTLLLTAGVVVFVFLSVLAMHVWLKQE
ncbi:MAG TPA: hypothetical protein VH186_06575 [Chloroflexia bacterium]|nr:hypothetical protein [Chloroflexia bacterium]